MLMKTQIAQAIDMAHLNLRLKKAHIALMKHVETALYAGCMMMGETELLDDPSITAFTDGVNKRYGAQFVAEKCQTDAELRALVLHENLHVALRHAIHGMSMYNEDPRRAGMAADYVVNGIIVNLKDSTLCTLPEGGLVDSKYFDWSMREVFDDLKKEGGGGGGSGKGPKGDERGNPGGSGEDAEDGEDEAEGEGDDGEGEDEGGENGGGFDNHDFSGKNPGKDAEGKDLDPQKINDLIDRALREGALLAGRLGGSIPRAISDSLVPKVDWREALRDFITASMSGKDEYTWRKFNRRALANDEYYPTTEDETVKEMIVAIDTSGSIGAEQLNEFAAELMSICETVQPDVVRVLWWGTQVVGEQLFDDKDYTGLISMLRPIGGGGTCAGSVAKHIADNNLVADCVIVLSDGYVEEPIQWDIQHPTLWAITMNKNMVVPAGGKFILVED
jgi:predicted metal-dependent peptidase